ncbi:MAG: hypothetical protein ACXV8O_05780 [Methylobacter sp.]
MSQLLQERISRKPAINANVAILCSKDRDDSTHLNDVADDEY